MAYLHYGAAFLTEIQVELNCSQFTSIHSIPNYQRTLKATHKEGLNPLMRCNGIKYNKDGGTLEISVSAVTDNALKISFTDNGIGIPATKMHRLFVPIDRLDIEQSTLNIEGTGLGLALCEKLVMEMGGRIEAKSQEGQGSTFTVTLTACPAPGTPP